MTKRITERIGTKVNLETQSWYQDKVIELATFIIKRIPDNKIILEEIKFNNYKKLEVISK